MLIQNEMKYFVKFPSEKFLVVTSAYVRTFFFLGGGGEVSRGGKRRESGVSPSEEEYVIFSWPEIVRYICTTRVFFLA